MKTVGMIALIAVITGVLGFAMFKLAGGGRREDAPGPHNNWRKNTSTTATSGWSESGQGSDVPTGSGEGGAD